MEKLNIILKMQEENKKHGYALRIGWFSFIAGLALSMIGSIMRM